MKERWIRRVEKSPWSARTVLALVCVLVTASAAEASITGVCPDGSMFIVQRAASVPCRGAKQVDPSDIPPMKPEFLPRPYGWEVFNRRNDPNNPYNLIRKEPMDARRAAPERQVRTSAPEQRVAVRQNFAPDPPAPVSAPPPTALVERTAPLGLANREIRDLAMIVELSQRRAPAALLARGTGGRVRLAQSKAFESRLRQRLSESGQPANGNVVLFSADTQQSGSFYGNLTFVQGHIAFQPDASDPSQLGLIHGALGELGTEEPVLGYVVLPEHIDLARPIDIYWNDLQITATLTP